MAPAEATSAYNILFLGEVQSGKSTLIESLKRYADPNYIFDTTNIGDDTAPHTQNVSVSMIRTNLPSYFISRSAETSGQGRVDLFELLQNDQEDYEDELNEREKYHLERNKSTATEVMFNLIDTPGLNNTSVLDLKTISTTFNALEPMSPINLVVVCITSNPFTESLTESIKAYSSFLPEFNGNMVFVHTNIDYVRLHNDDRQFAHALEDRKRILQELVGRDSAVHFLIDNDIDSNRPVRECITHNTLRELLAMGQVDPPNSIPVRKLKKTEGMRIVDGILRFKYSQKITYLEEALDHHNQTRYSVQERLDSIKAKIAEREKQLQQIREYLRVNDNDSLELIHEELYQQDFSTLNMMEGAGPMYYPGRKRAVEPGFLHHVIDHIDIRTQNIEVLQETGGKGQEFWAVKFRRRKRQNGIYHVKIYITRRKKFTNEIVQRKAQMDLVKELLEDSKADLQSFETLHAQAEVPELEEDLRTYRYLHARVSESMLSNRIFQALVDAKVYVRDYSESAANLEKFYLTRRLELEDLENDQTVPVLPSTSSESSEEIERSEESKYSILLLGKTQAGKSTFVQFVKNYADPQYKIDMSKMGHYTESTTGKIERFVVRSDLPEYEVCHSNTGTIIDTQGLSQSFEDEDDYRDVVNSRGSDTVLRKVPRNLESLPPEPVTIQFVDTPGINDTNDRDVEHARNIIDQMVGPWSFNLIVVIVNSHLAIYKEQQAAFDYYSRITHALQGHHSNVVFLYTHVEYADCHHSNTKHHSTMEQRHRTFSYLFRGQERMAAEGELDLKAAKTEDFELYPFYTIDHSLRDRPIIQCLIRNTLRDILLKAISTPPTTLNISKENLEHVFGIKHPDKDNHEQREKARTAQQGELEQRQSAESTEGNVPAMQATVAESMRCDEAVTDTMNTRTEDTKDFEMYFPSNIAAGDDSQEDEDA
ncbi:hypothetical protein BGZ93_011146 [Podila epicladia]|nr:hypothetical protein BGZ92_002704 [Podila epicladia]KAG0087107.1 hypothetical protein BGZ93_011146 [Podila epicladia]